MAGSVGALAGSKPRRFTYSWPSGNSGPACLAKRTASVVLPTPAVPVISTTGDACGAPSGAGCCPGSSACSQLSSTARPAKPLGSGGSCAGHGASAAESAGAAAAGVPAGGEAGTGKAGAWAGSAKGPGTAGTAGGTARLAAGASSAGSIASSRSCSLVSSAPGLMPSSSASRSRASRKTRNASAWRPDRYRATISSPRARSRSGCSAVSAASSGTAATCCPWSSIRSARSSAAVVRNSASRWRSASANGPGTPANGWPRHSASASFTAHAAPSVSPAARSPRARSRHSSKCPASRPPGPRRSR